MLEGEHHERHHPKDQRLVAPHCRDVPDPDSVPGNTAASAGRCLRQSGLPGRQDHRTRLTVKREIAARSTRGPLRRCNCSIMLRFGDFGDLMGTEAVAHCALAQGVNYLGTADSYSIGLSDEKLG